MLKNENCPCCSGLKFNNCCLPYHEGAIPPSAEKLMRSRYSAYSLCLPDYIVATTHPTKRKTIQREEVIEW